MTCWTSARQTPTGRASAGAKRASLGPLLVGALQLPHLLNIQVVALCTSYINLTHFNSSPDVAQTPPYCLKSYDVFPRCS